MNATISTETPNGGSLHPVVSLRQEARRCKQHELYARRANLIAAAQAWRFRRWGIEFAIRTIKQANEKLFGGKDNL